MQSVGEQYDALRESAHIYARAAFARRGFGRIEAFRSLDARFRVLQFGYFPVRVFRGFFQHAADLAPLPLLCSRQAMLSNELSGWLGYDFAKLNVISTHNLLHNAALMVRAGMGYAMTIDKLVGDNDPELTFRPLEPKMEAALFFAWKKYQVFSKAAEKFLETLQKLI